MKASVKRNHLKVLTLLGCPLNSVSAVYVPKDGHGNDEDPCLI
jgi:hypothetical protein